MTECGTDESDRSSTFSKRLALGMEWVPLSASLCTGPGHRPGGVAEEQPQVSRCAVGDPVETGLGRAQLQAGSHLTQAGHPGTHHSRSPRHLWVCLPSQACSSCNLSFGSQPLSQLQASSSPEKWALFHLAPGMALSSN